MAVRVPTKKEVAALLVAHGIADFVTGGKFAKFEMRALWSMLKKLGPPAVRTTPRLGSTAWIIASRHPYLAVSGLVAAGLLYPDEREQFVREIQEGTQTARDIVERGSGAILQVQERSGFDIGGTQAGAAIRGGAAFARRDYSGGRSFSAAVLPTQTRKKRPSKFNQAIKAGMAAIKKSTSYGGKGKIKPAKKAFTVVVKLAAAKKKKKKAPKSGIKRKIWLAMRGY